ncbi:MAG: sensor histidine kinase [Sporichthyaceae bacterium]
MSSTDRRSGSTSAASSEASGRPAAADREGVEPHRAAHRASLAARFAGATALVALVAVLLAGAVALPLVGRAAEDQARRQLAASADLVAGTVDGRALGQAVGLAKLRQLLARQEIDLLVLRPRVAAALDPADVEAVAAGGSVSGTRTVDGRRSLVEARPTADGVGIALVQPRSVVVSPRKEAARRLFVALAVGLAGGAAAGFGLAWRLARPLRRAAAAAQELAAGRRDVRIPPDGPAEVAAVAEAINDLAAALAASEAGQREFLLSISHELRTPLTAVRGYAEALADGVVPPERTAATGATVLAEAERLHRLVEDLMDLARLRARSFPIDASDVDLGELLRAAEQVWRDRAAVVGATVSTELPPDRGEARSDVAAAPLARASTTIRTDPVRVRQIVDGLAENALRVLEPGGTLVLALRVEPDAVVLEVRDSGPGLTDADLAVAFEPSALHDRYRGTRRVGAGVGLALIDGLVRLLGGTASAGHAPEGGASFTVRLPRDAAAASTDPILRR